MGVAPEKQARFLALKRVNLSHVARRYAVVYARGRHATAPDHVSTRLSESPEWILAYIPIRALNYQTAEESGAPRISRARAYAMRPGPLPPGIAKYGKFGQRRKLAKGFVADGNHRVMAAVLRGDRAIRMYMPLTDYVALVRDASKYTSRGSR